MSLTCPLQRGSLSIYGQIAGLDNFCWPDPTKSEKNPDGEYNLAQLVRSNQALYDYTKAFEVPCISGKDSMKNDSAMGGKKISIIPTLLFSAVSRMDDISKSLTLDAKFAGDLVCVIGMTKPELGGSEYLAMLGKTGNSVPRVDAKFASKTYDRVSRLSSLGLLHSLHSPALGGIATGFAKIAIAGRLGLEIDIDGIPCEGVRCAAEILFSKSNSRFVASLPPGNLQKTRKIMSEIPFAVVGTVIEKQRLVFRSRKFKSANFAIPLEKLVRAYKNPLDGV